MSKITISLELTGITRDGRAVLDAVGTRLALAANQYVNTWYAWHAENASGDQLAAWMAELREWHQSEKQDRGAKPKCPVAFDPPELRKQLSRILPQTHEKTNSRVLTLLAQWLRKTLTTSNKGLSEWIEILLHRRRTRQFINGVPIPVDRANASLVVGEDDQGKDQLRFRFRIDRIPEEGKSRCGSHQLEFGLRAGGKRARYAGPLWKMAREGGAISGSRLVYHRSKRKWFVAFTVDAPEEEARVLDKDKVAVVCPGWHRPFLIRVNGKTVRHGFRGEHVGFVRQKILRQRLSRQHWYRIGAGQQRKGHGRRRAIAAWEGRLSRQWSSFTKLNNNQWSHDLAERLAKMQVGKVILIQPTEGRRFLETTGQIPDYESSSGWDWTQWIAMASRKCSRTGMKVQVQKCSQHRNRTKRLAAERVA